MAKRLFQSQKLQAPSIRIRIFLKSEIFFSVLTFRLHVNGVFLAPKTQVFENGSRSGDFLKRRLLSFNANGRKKVFEYFDVIHILLALRMPGRGIHYNFKTSNVLAFLSGRANSRFKYPSCGRVFFNGRNKSLCSPISVFVQDYNYVKVPPLWGTCTVLRGKAHSSNPQSKL